MRTLPPLFVIALLVSASACHKKEASRAPPPTTKSARPSATPATAPTADPCASKPDRKVGAATTQGVFAGVQKAGKRLRIFVRSKRRLVAFRVPHEVHGYFFIAHRGKPLTLGYDLVDACFPQIGEYRRINQLASVASGSLTGDAWWRGLQRQPGAAAAARKAFIDYVEGPFRK